MPAAEALIQTDRASHYLTRLCRHISSRARLQLSGLRIL
jgi:hypothetical protein